MTLFLKETHRPIYIYLRLAWITSAIRNGAVGGGRLVQSEEQPNRWEDGETAQDFNPFTQKMDPAYPQVRWLEAIQQDFAGRADWCILDYASANHPPEVKALSANFQTASPGDTVQVQLEVSDPDGDELETEFWVYEEVGTYEGEVEILSFELDEATVFLPPTGVGTLHLMAEVRDQAEHPMTRYQRFVIQVE